jgi:predicted transcriptional regulator
VSSLEHSSPLPSQQPLAAPTRPRTRTKLIATRRILQAIVESSDVDHFGGTTQSRIIIYARLDHKTLKPYLDVLLDLGLITKQIITHENAHHARCTWEKTLSKRVRYKTIYKVSDKGYSWLQQLHEREKQQ